MNHLQITLFTALFVPGFCLTFLIGWRRRRQGKPTFLKIGLWSVFVGTLCPVLCFGLLMAFFFYATRTVVTYHSDRPLTVEEARQGQCPIPLPNSAKNVRFAVACGGIQAYELLVRFEAPPDVCRAEIQACINARAAEVNVAGRPMDPGVQSLIKARASQDKRMSYPVNLHPLTPAPPRVIKEMFDAGKTSWFDVQNIVHGETENDAPYVDQQFWIDEDRGIFYYNCCD